MNAVRIGRIFLKFGIEGGGVFFENPLRKCEFGKIGQKYLALYVEI
jgi:hypothetical protein